MFVVPGRDLFPEKLGDHSAGFARAQRQPDAASPELLSPGHGGGGRSFFRSLRLLLALLLCLAAPVLAQNSASTDPLSVGALRLGLSEDEVEKILGAPETRYDSEYVDNLALHAHSVSYASGATLVYRDNPQVAAPGVLLAILVDPPCDWRAVGGLSLGMAASQARAILADQLDQGAQPMEGDGPDSEAVFYADSGTVLLLRFVQDKVSHLYLGPDLR